MVGFSRNISTNQDFRNLLEHYPEQTKAWLEDQLTAKERWITIKKLYLAGDEYLDENGDTQTYATDEEYPEDDTHRIVAIENEEGVVTQKYGEEFMVDPNWYPIARLGLTLEEIDSILAG